MKTRIFAILLAVVCLFSFASCEKDTPYSLYVNAMKSMEESKGFDATVSVTMKMMGATTTVEMDVKANGDSMAMSSEGYSIVYVGGVMYMSMDMMGTSTKTKTELSLEEFKEEYGEDMITDEYFPTLTEEDFAEIELVENDDGTRSFTKALDTKDIEKLINDSLDGLIEDDVELKDISMTATFDKDDSIKALSIKVGDLMTMSFTFNSMTAPEITAPADADEYKEENFDLDF